MALNIKDPETDDLVRRLAALTGQSLTGAVQAAVRDRLEREERRRGRASAEDLLAIARRYAARPVKDHRSPEEILGYDERGLPG